MRLLTWIGAVVSAAVIWEIAAYTRASDSNHTSFEPWFLLVVFVQTIVLGFLTIRRRRDIFAAVFAIVIGGCGIATLTYIDRTNTMVQYDRWLSRGMPLAHQASQHTNIH